MLRSRTALVALAAAVLLALRFLPLGPGASPAGLLSGQGASSGSQPQGTGEVKGKTARPTPRPATIDPGRAGDQTHPFLVLRSATVKQGAAVVVGGQSFQGEQEMSISLHPKDGGEGVELGTAIADKDGYLQDVSLPLPGGLKEGLYTVVATPILGGPSVEASLQVSSGDTWGQLGTTTAKPGGSVDFEGGGFKPGESVALHLDNLGLDAIAAVTASPEGTVSGSLSVPLAAEGDHIILFYGDQSKTPAIANLNIQGFHPWVVLDNYSPAPEQAVGFAGSDFTPGERVYIFLGSLESRPLAMVQAGPDGTFKAAGALKLTPDVKGEQKMLFVGEQSQTAVEADFTVLPYPGSVQLTLYAGPPGTQVAFIGSGFARGEEVDAYVGEPGSGEKVSTFKADSKGNFAGAGSFRVPRDTKAGDLTLSLVGQVSEVQATVTFTVIPISPWAEAKPDRSGKAVVLGHGFAPGEAVDLLLSQGGDKPLATTAVDKDGNAAFAPLEVAVESQGKPTTIRLKGRESAGETTVEYYGSGTGESGAEPAPRSEGSLEFQPSPSQTPSATQMPAATMPLLDLTPPTATPKPSP